MRRSNMFDELLVAILAAGASHRLGQPKQLVRIGDEPLLRRQCRIAIEAHVGPVTTILGCQADACLAALNDLSVSVRTNEQWAEGLASSIREAVRAAVEINAAGVLILHCDHYRVSAGDLQSIHAAWTKSGASTVCRARHEDYAGPPVIFPASCFSKLLVLQGDEGARRVISAFDANLVIDVAMRNAVYDLDLPEQLADLATRGEDINSSHVVRSRLR
jgi:molybdenum cofactor cytidylyltransferase